MLPSIAAPAVSAGSAGPAHATCLHRGTGLDTFQTVSSIGQRIWHGLGLKPQLVGGYASVAASDNRKLIIGIERWTFCLGPWFTALVDHELGHVAQQIVRGP